MLEHLKNTRLKEAIEVRTKLMQAGMTFMVKEGFLHPPVYMFSSITDPLAHKTYPTKMDYYGTNIPLMHSLIFHKMVLVSCSEISRAFWFSPNIRLELDNSPRYATEFTQLDFEKVNWNLKTTIEFTIELVETLLKSVGRDFKIIRVMKNMKREAYDRFDNDSKVYQNFDLEIDGIEICSGAEREWEYKKLKNRMIDLNYDLKNFEPILSLAKAGLLKPSAGAGIGIERLTWALMDSETIDVCYPFSRKPQQKIGF